MEKKKNWLTPPVIYNQFVTLQLQHDHFRANLSPDVSSCFTIDLQTGLLRSVNPIQVHYSMSVI